jgi:hypothetical protein
MDFSPTQLSEIDAVDVVNLKGVDVDRVSEYMSNAVDVPHVQIVDELAQQIADLWRHLPSGEQSRCHIPPFGLRFYRNGELQLQASICWECDNIFGDTKGDSFWYAFDSQHQTAQKLLALCKQVFESR